MHAKRSMGSLIVAVVAVAFGLLTIKSGGAVLFIGGEFRQQTGNYIPFVLWFNFLAGFVYLLAGIGFWEQKRWLAWLAIMIIAACVSVFALLGLHINSGGGYEMRGRLSHSIHIGQYYGNTKGIWKAAVLADSTPCGNQRNERSCHPDCEISYS